MTYAPMQKRVAQNQTHGGDTPDRRRMRLGGRRTAAESSAEHFALTAGLTGSEHPSLARPTASDGSAQTLDLASELAINNARLSGGEPLPLPVRWKLALSAPSGAPLEHLRIHRGPRVDVLARRLDTRAFSVGNDLFFAQGEYRPQSRSGFHLLAHEAAHAIQPGRDSEIVRRAPPPLPEETNAWMSRRFADEFGLSPDELSPVADSTLGNLYREAAPGEAVGVKASKFKRIDPLIERPARITPLYKWTKAQRLIVSFHGVRRDRAELPAVALKHLQLQKDIAVFGVIQANTLVPDIAAAQPNPLTQAQRDVVVHETGLFVQDWSSRCHAEFGDAGPDAAWMDYWGRGEWVKDALAAWLRVAGAIELQMDHLRPPSFSADLSASPEEHKLRVEAHSKSVVLPIIHEKGIREGTDAGTIEITDLTTFAKRRGSDHVPAMLHSIERSEHGVPPWMKEVNVVLSQPGAHAIDTSLALVIALRESGPNSYRNAEWIDTYHGSGLDTLYTYGSDYAKSGLVPDAWVRKKNNPDFVQGARTANGHAAEIPGRRVMAFLFAGVGRARLNLEYHITRIYEKEGPDAEAMVDALPPIARRIWVAISFGGTGGSLDLATVSPGHSGVRTFLKAFHDANLPLSAIVDIGAAIAGRTPTTPEEAAALKFLHRALAFDRLNIAAKTAITAMAFD